jgi:hypothetical protein
MTDISIQTLKSGHSAALAGGLFAGISSFFSILGAARSCAAALEAGRKPDPRHLQRLGIDPRSFAALRDA